MTDTNEDLVLDADGIPILTELVHDDETPAEAGQQRGTGIADAAPADIAGRLLTSDYFHRQLDEITVELAQNMRHQAEQTLRPAVEQAIILALEDSGTQSAETIRQQLETALPGMIARALEK
jgi:hypothetical protein